MSPPRSKADHAAAIEAMFRIRAVESPPDDKGERTIWHRGSRGAELVSWVDSGGLMLRQELSLFDDTIIWQRGSGLKTGTSKGGDGSKAGPASGRVDLDASPKSDRVDRVAAALAGYVGADRFIGHIRDVISSVQGVGALGEDPVTRPAMMVHQALREAESSGVREKKRKQNLRAAMIAGGVAVVAAALALLFMK